MIISLVNQKGGVGKTSIAVNLGACLARKNYKIQLIDMDPQGTALQWQSIEGNMAFQVIHHPAPLSPDEAKAFSQGYDHLVMDTPPAIGEISKSVLHFSDLALVPVAPSPLDIWSSHNTVRMIVEAKNENPALEGKLLICRKIPRTRLGREAKEVMQVFKLPVFETEVSQRVAYIEAMISGVSVLQYAPKSEAAREMQGLCEEVAQHLKKH
jgi:chromosome partitioning protein